MAKPTAQELARERLKKKFVSELTRSQHEKSKFWNKYGVRVVPYEEYEKMTNEQDERNVDLPITTFEEGYLYPETLHTKRVPYEGDTFGYHWYNRNPSRNTPFFAGAPPVARSKLERDLNQYILETKGKGEYRNAYELAKAQGGDQSYKHGQSRLEPGDGVSDFSKRQSRLEEMPEEEYETPVSGQTRVK